MTRQEFIDEICDFSALIQFCGDENLDTCEEIYDEDSLSEYLDYEISGYLNEYNWEYLRGALDGIPTGYEYYIRTDWMEFNGADDGDFDEYKEDVLSIMDDGDYWDEDDEENNEDNEEPTPQNNSEPDDETPIEEESVSIIELVNICHSQLVNINNI